MPGFWWRGKICVLQPLAILLSFPLQLGSQDMNLQMLPFPRSGAQPWWSWTSHLANWGSAWRLPPKDGAPSLPYPAEKSQGPEPFKWWPQLAAIHGSAWIIFFFDFPQGQLPKQNWLWEKKFLSILNTMIQRWNKSVWIFPTLSTLCFWVIINKSLKQILFWD